jgi:hypothetical protein
MDFIGPMQYIGGDWMDDLDAEYGVCLRSGPQVDRKWTEVGPAQKWAEVSYFRSTSGRSLSPASRVPERSGPGSPGSIYERLE